MKKTYPKRTQIAKVLLIALLAALFSLFPRDSAFAMKPMEIYKKKAPAVVVIFSEINKHQGSGGTGYFINSDGLIITNAHVVTDDKGNPIPKITVFIKPDNVTGDFAEDLKNGFAAHVVKFTIPLDIAVLKIEGYNRPPAVISLADSDKVAVGQRVVAIGHPEQAGLWTLTTGLIGAKRLNSAARGKNLFQTDASINHGNSGGPLMDENGESVGMTTAMSRVSKNDGSAVTGINWALQSNVLKKWLEGQGIEPQAATAVSAQVDENPDTVTEPSEKRQDNGKPKSYEGSGADTGKVITPKRPFEWDSVQKTVEDLMVMGLKVGKDIGSKLFEQLK